MSNEYERGFQAAYERIAKERPLSCVNCTRQAFYSGEAEKELDALEALAGDNEAIWEHVARLRFVIQQRKGEV